MFSCPSEDSTVLQKDLMPIYTTQCEKYGRLFFCVHYKKVGIFKYIVADDKLFRVQCECCDIEWGRVEMCQQIHKHPVRAVDDDSKNFLDYQFHNSYLCGKTGEIVICATYKNNQKVKVMINPNSERISMHRRDCGCNRRVEMEDAFEHGAQGVQHTRYHRDAMGRPLLCVALTEHSPIHKSMDYFCNQDGDIGQYTFDEQLKCFTLTDSLYAKVQPFQGARYKELHFDDELRIWYGQLCPELKALVFFGSYKESKQVNQFVFNRGHGQFEQIESDFCVFDHEKMIANLEKELLLGLFASPFNSRPIALIKKANGRVEKREVINGIFEIMERAPIRRYEFSPEEFARRQERIEKLVRSSVHSFLDSEKYELRSFTVDHPSPSRHFSHIATLDGQIREFQSIGSDCYKEKNYVLVEEPRKEKKTPTLLEFATEKAEEMGLTGLKKVFKKFHKDDYDVAMITQGLMELFKGTEEDSKDYDDDLSDTESTVTAVDFTPSERAMQLINSMKLLVVDDDLSDTETAIEPSDDEVSDTETALEPSEDDWSDTETALESSDDDWSETDTAIEPSDDEVSDTETALEQSDDEVSDTETALEPSDDDWSDTETALELSSSDVSNVSFLEKCSDGEVEQDVAEEQVNADMAAGCSIC